MSNPSFRARNLESLKKEAKRWLGALRLGAADARARFERALPGAPAEPTLRDVQHALAREHGFPGWAELRRRLDEGAAEPISALGRFEEMAEALLDAYHTGTPAAMERHWALTWHRRNHKGMRTYVQLDLGRQAGDPDIDADITFDDARYLVAREHGFDGWDAVVEHCARVAQTTSHTTAKPVRVLGGEAHDAPQAWRSRDWNEVLAHLKESAAAGIDADGQMTDAMLADLARIEHISTLRLGGSKPITDAGLRHLARLTGLRHLDLSGTAITDAGLAVLHSLPALETISLARTAVTDSGLVHLGTCEHLREVNLQGTATGDCVLRVLAGKPHLGHLRTGNGVTDAGLALLHEFPVFQRWHGGEPTMSLTSYDAGPNYLLLRGPFTDRGMSHLAGLDGLFALNLDAAELAITAAGLAPLVSLPNLGWLAIDATDDSMPHVARMPRLRFLGCQDTVAGDAGFQALSQSASIEYIWGRRCHNLRTSGFASLARMPALRALSVSCKKVDDSGIATLPRFPALRELMPMDVPDAGYRHIAQCQALESLVLMYCRETTDAATEHLVGMPRLARYFASYTRITDRSPELLSRVETLESITFASCANLTNAGLTHLARLPLLRDLDVSGPHITPDLARVFPARVRVRVSPG